MKTSAQIAAAPTKSRRGRSSCFSFAGCKIQFASSEAVFAWMDSNFSYTPNGNIYFQAPKKYERPVVPNSGLLLLEALPHVHAQLERFDSRRAGTYNARIR